MGSVLRAVLPYAIGGVVALLVGWGVVAYLEHQGALKERGTQAAKELKDTKETIKAQDTAKKIQKKEVTHARKEVDDAYRAGCVPVRVRKFYIDQPVTGVSGSLRRCG